jgi:hypothetical protein
MTGCDICCDRSAALFLIGVFFAERGGSAADKSTLLQNLIDSALIDPKPLGNVMSCLPEEVPLPHLNGVVEGQPRA